MREQHLFDRSQTTSGASGRSSQRTALAASASAIAITAALSAFVFLGDAPAVNAGQESLSKTAPSVQTAGQPLPSFADLVEHVSPAVVSVYVKAQPEVNVAARFPNGNSDNPFPKGTPFEKFFKQFGAPQQHGPGDDGPDQIVRAQGSGFFISDDGFVLTNNHVVAHAKEVEIKTTGGDTYKAKIVGTDPKTDLALLKVDHKSKFPFVKFAEKAPRIGDWVVAMGNPFGLGGTVTAGIVSANGRDIGSGPYDDFLQIDAPVNKGNSGGPTFNLNGEVVGINTAIFSPSGGSVGIAFDIPARTAKAISDQLAATGSVTRGWMGVQIQPVTQDIAASLGLKDDVGALVVEPQEASPALKAGLQSEDVIIAVDGQEVKDARDLARKIANFAPGKTVKIDVMRGGAQRSFDVKLEPYPEEQAANDKSDGGALGEPRLGLTLAPAKDVAGAGDQGVVITNVDPSGAAADKGISQGDVILDVAGQHVATPAQVKAALEKATKDGKRAILVRVKTAQGSRFVAFPIG
jgi:serine protease Do